MARVGLITVVLAGCTYTAPAIQADGSLPPDGTTDTPVDMPPDTPAPFWTGVQGADAVANTLTKTTSVSGWGDAGASSTQTVTSGDCFVEFKTSEASTGKALGLSQGDINQSFNDIDFDIVLGANRKLYIYEGPTLRGQFGTYVAADTFRVEVVGGIVRYRQNGTLLFTSSIAPTYPLLVDAALFSPGATITDVVFTDQ